ncbi:MAG: transcription elongation factor GreB [Desulfuromonadia bacterium]
MSSHKGKTNYITAEGAKRLREELAWLWKEERPRVTQRVADAAAEGDRSENAEYIYGKKRLREIDRRIRFLTERLDSLTVVDAMPEGTTRVYFGAWVRLEDEEGSEQLFRIVGPDEFDPKRGWISIDSPVGKALLGKNEGDEVTVDRPAGRVTWTIVEVSYRPEGE